MSEPGNGTGLASRMFGPEVNNSQFHNVVHPHCSSLERSILGKRLEQVGKREMTTEVLGNRGGLARDGKWPEVLFPTVSPYIHRFPLPVFASNNGFRAHKLLTAASHATVEAATVLFPNSTLEIGIAVDHGQALRRGDAGGMGSGGLWPLAPWKLWLGWRETPSRLPLPVASGLASSMCYRDRPGLTEDCCTTPAVRPWQETGRQAQATQGRTHCDLSRKWISVVYVVCRNQHTACSVGLLQARIREWTGRP